MNSESTMDLQKRRAARLWARLEEVFGNGRWKRLRGEVAPGVWLAGIAMLGNEEVRHGLKRLVTDWPGDADPPTWPQFRDLCRPRDGRTPEQRALSARIEREHPARLRGPESESGPRHICDTVEAIDTTQTGRAWLEQATGKRHDPAMAAAVEAGRDEILARMGIGEDA